MNKIIKIYSLLTAAIIASLAIVSCNKDLESHTSHDYDPTVPAQVSAVKVVNQNGKATISYTLPNDPHLLYVKAVYTITNGKQYEAKSSYYGNSLVVEGYADTLQHEVKLYSVNRSEVMSEPITVTIKPLEAPIFSVFRSLLVQNAFGGYNLTAVNSTKANISILVTKKNVFNEYEVDNNYSIFTNTDSISSKVRGLDTNIHRFGFVVMDRWGNKTDTVYKDIKALYEVEFPSSNFSAFVLPGDAPQVTNGAALPFAWDGKLGWPFTSFTDQFTGGPNPHMVTFSLGVLGKISRIFIIPFPEGTRYYYLSTMKRFEIYGSSNPSLSGALDNTWNLLGSYTVVKPSGLPYGTDNGTDQATAAAGFNWEVDLAAPKVKYIRVRCLENFAGGTAQSMNEIKVFGDPR
jgi:hypothetical protein